MPDADDLNVASSTTRRYDSPAEARAALTESLAGGAVIRANGWKARLAPNGQHVLAIPEGSTNKADRIKFASPSDFFEDLERGEFGRMGAVRPAGASLAGTTQASRTAPAGPPIPPQLAGATPSYSERDVRNAAMRAAIVASAATTFVLIAAAAVAWIVLDLAR